MLIRMGDTTSAGTRTAEPSLRQAVSDRLPEIGPLPAPGPQSLDRRLYTAVNSLPHTSGSDEYLELLSDLGKGAGWVAGSAWLALRDGARGRRAGAAATVAMFAAVILVQNGAKRVLRRRRPFIGRVVTLVGAEPKDPSFPSGHTAGSFAAATALGAFYPRDRPILVSLAAAVGLSRVYLGHHFPTDVGAGAAVGWAIGALAARVFGSNRLRR